MLSAIFKPSILVDFLMLRVVNRLARSTTPTWSTVGEVLGSGELAKEELAIDMVVSYKDRTADRRLF
jgi:hypothetical protein